MVIFNLNVLFTNYRSPDVNQYDYFFQMPSYPHAYDKNICTIYERTKGANSLGKITLYKL